MAQSFKDSARQLRDKAALQFPAKGAQVTVDGKVWPLDRVYVEAYTASDDTLTKFPTPDKARVPDRCVIGSYHPSDAYMKLVDAYKVGSGDNDSNWQLTYKLDLQLWASNAVAAAAAAGTLTVAFSTGPVTSAAQAASNFLAFAGVAQVGQEHEITVESGGIDEVFYFADADASDGRIYLGAASGVLETDRDALAAAILASLGPAGTTGQVLSAVEEGGLDGITLTSAATGASAYVTVTDTGPDFLWTSQGTTNGADAVSSTITIEGTGGISRAFTWAWSDPGGGVTYMGQGNAGAASARNALVTAINAYAPLAAVLTAANVSTQSFSLTSVATGTSAYVSASSSGADIWTGEGTGTGTAATMQITWPDILAKDGYQKGDEYGQDSSVITWAFEIVNPDAYTAPAQNGTVAHPVIASAKFVSETFFRNGPTAQVSRRYERFATLSSFVADDGPGTVSKVDVVKGPTITQPALVAGKVVQRSALGTAFSQTSEQGIVAGGQERFDYVANDGDGTVKRTKREVLNTVASPTPVAGSDVTQQSLNSAWSQRVTTGLVSGGTRYDYEFHPETRDLVTIKREILNTVSAPTQAVKQHVTQQSLNSAWCLRVTRSIAGGGTGGRPTPFEYYKWIDYPVFRLLSGFNILTYGSAFQIDPIVRSGYTKKHRCRVSVDFHETNPALSTLFEPHPVDIAYDGFTFSVFEQNVITDEWEIENTGIETYTTPESDPTYTEYLALIGDEVLINEILTPWDFQLIRRTRYYITLE